MVVIIALSTSRAIDEGRRTKDQSTGSNRFIFRSWSRRSLSRFAKAPTHAHRSFRLWSLVEQNAPLQSLIYDTSVSPGPVASSSFATAKALLAAGTPAY